MSNVSTFNAEFTSTNNFNAVFDTVVEVLPDAYDGQYEFTPTDEQQIIEIKRKSASDDIVINAIPSNYGRITWDGVGIKVS